MVTKRTRAKKATSTPMVDPTPIEKPTGGMTTGDVALHLSRLMLMVLETEARLSNATVIAIGQNFVDQQKSKAVREYCTADFGMLRFTAEKQVFLQDQLDKDPQVAKIIDLRDTTATVANALVFLRFDKLQWITKLFYDVHELCNDLEKSFYMSWTIQTNTNNVIRPKTQNTLTADYFSFSFIVSNFFGESQHLVFTAEIIC